MRSKYFIEFTSSHSVHDMTYLVTGTVSWIRLLYGDRQMTDTGWGRAVPNLMEIVTFPFQSRLMRASSGVLSGVRSKARRVYPSLKAFLDRNHSPTLWPLCPSLCTARRRPVVKMVFTSNF